MASLNRLAPLLLISLLFLLDVCTSASGKETSRSRRKKRDAGEDLEVMRRTLEALSWQMMVQQEGAEEKVRSDGASGIKVMRQIHGGVQTYDAAAYAVDAMSSIHEHADSEDTAGMGEVTAVLNGVEFRTRHNDYKLVRPSSHSIKYHETEPIPFPDVPDSVENADSVDDQIQKMKQYFRAFKEQDLSIEDYRPYFVPILCYLEGAWTTNTEQMEEPFNSDRHYIDAKTWKDLTQKNKFTVNSGRKEPKENYAYLPTKITDVTEDGLPVMAQWNYRILCHHLHTDLPTNRLRVVDDLALRMAHKKNMSLHEMSRHARFKINPDNTPYWEDKITNRTYLDTLMEQIPGKNNYKGSLGDWSFGTPARQVNSYDNREPDVKNTGFYHRYFRVKKSRGIGTVMEHRGYSDSNVFMAMTDHPQVADTTLTLCDKTGCSTERQRWSYAIPLEVIYLTPLFKWNPYKLVNKGDFRSDLGKTVKAYGRDGSSPDRAFDGINSKAYYMTPAEFIDQQETSSADTSFKKVYVRDPWGNSRHVVGAGQRIFANIPEVGKIRLRYPVAPVYGEGSAVWKEMDAMKDILMHSHKYSEMFQEPLTVKPNKVH